MTFIPPDKFFYETIVPTLVKARLYSPVASFLLLGTALEESGIEHLKQLDGGPALGYYQMEPKTHDDIWENYLEYRPELAAKVREFVYGFGVVGEGGYQQLITNPPYSTIMCRVHYLRVKEALPEYGDIKGYASYWKKWYNTQLGKGSEASFVETYHSNITW